MSTRARPAGAIRPSARVLRWQAEQDRRVRWPADRDAVVAEVLAAGRIPVPACPAGEGESR